MNETNLNISDDISILKQYVILRHEKEEVKIVSVSSVARGESKTNLSIELAKGLAEQKYKTLLIDLDLYSPGVGKRLGLRDEYGITDYVGKVVKKDEAIIKENSHLDVIMTGSDIKNIEAFLVSGLLNNAILDLSKDYDLVIINNSPFNSLKDVEGPSNYADSAILCIAQNFDSKKDLQKVKRYIDEASLNLMGIIITSAKNNFKTKKEEKKERKKLVFNNKVKFKSKGKSGSELLKGISKEEDAEEDAEEFEEKPKKKLFKKSVVNKKENKPSVKNKKPASKTETKNKSAKKPDKPSKTKKTEKAVKKPVVKKKVKKADKKPVVKKQVKAKPVKTVKPVKATKPVLSEKDRIRAALASQKLKDRLRK